MTMTEPLAGDISALKAYKTELQGTLTEANAEVKKLEEAWKASGKSTDDIQASIHEDAFKDLIAANKAQGEARDEMLHVTDALLALQGPAALPVHTATGKTELSPGDEFMASDEYGAADWNRRETSAVVEVANATRLGAYLASADPGALGVPMQTGITVPLPQRPFSLLDIVNVSPMTASEGVYFVEISEINNATELAQTVAGVTVAAVPGYQEGVPVTPPVSVPTPESEFSYDKRTIDNKRIGHHYKAGRFMIEDAPWLQDQINVRGPRGIRRRLEGQLLGGDGTGETLTGIANTPGILAAAKGADTLSDAIYKTFTLISLANEDELPNGVAMHPNLYQEFVLQKDGNLNYMNHAGATASARPTVWGRAAVTSSLFSPTTALIGDYSQATLWVRSGIRSEAGFINDQFIRDEITMNFEARFGFGVIRPAAFTLLDAS